MAVEYPPIHKDGLLTVINLWDAALLVPDAVEVVQVEGAPACGIPLLTNGHLGADMLYVAPGESFPLHVHGGHHFLLCVGGRGSVTFGGKVHEILPGDLYMIEAEIEHAVGAAEEGPGHWLVAFGAPHAHIDSDHRMEVIHADDH